MSETPDQIFKAMPSAFLPGKAGSMEVDLHFSLSGEHGGDWVVEIARGTCQVIEGTVKIPVASVSMTDQDFMDIFGKRLNAVAAYMTGRVRVKGDVAAIMSLISCFDFPD